jgi:D-glycero-D-manno-heptose 1,7-bisphosphate phosphatase
VRPRDGRTAVFLDRDGTIIEDENYLRDPDRMRLIPGVGPAISRLNANNWAAVVVTNQSGIARGLLSVDDYRATERRLNDLLAKVGARLDGQYFCPHLPELTGPCQCRKPGTLLYRQAAEQLGLDLSRSWWVGDRVRDLLPAKTFGAPGVLLANETGKAVAHEAARHGFLQAPDLRGAVELILNPSSELTASSSQFPDS